MIIKTEKQRIYVAFEEIEAVYPQDSLARFDDDGYYVRTSSGEFGVSHEIGEALLDKLEERERENERRETLARAAAEKVVDRIRRLAEPHAHDAEGKCVIDPPRDPGEWLREIERDLTNSKPGEKP